jgi:aspartate/glutamate racemase
LVLDAPTENDGSQKVIGLIGGMSWESSAEYYRIINQTVPARLGGLRSARCLMWSFDFGEIEALQHAGRWDEAAAEMVAAAQRLGNSMVGTAGYRSVPVRIKRRSAAED